MDADLGVNVKVVGNLRAYAEVSESENPPTAAAAGPSGEGLLVAKGLGVCQSGAYHRLPP